MKKFLLDYKRTRSRLVIHLNKDVPAHGEVVDVLFGVVLDADDTSVKLATYDSDREPNNIKEWLNDPEGECEFWVIPFSMIHAVMDMGYDSPKSRKARPHPRKQR